MVFIDIYYAFDGIQKFLDLIEDGTFPNYLIYGGWHLQKSGAAKIIDMKSSGTIKNSTVIINVPKYAPGFKARGNRVILINLNSNHILQRNNNFLTKWALKRIYNSADVIMCLDKSQIAPLKKLGVTTRLLVNPLYIDMEDMDRIAGQLKYGFKTYSPYYLSSGFDTGRDFSIFTRIDTEIPIVPIGRFNGVSYLKYCRMLLSSRGVVLHILNSAGSSDLSGSTTVFEGLCAKKPVFINEQYWLKNFPSKNIYVYKTEKELEDLLNSNKEWIEEKANFTFGQFMTKLKKVLKCK